jgi:hypothetical protein
MNLIYESVIDGIPIRYYKGMEVSKVVNHSKDGSDGMMIIFSDSIKEEKTKHNRNSKIEEILLSKVDEDFDKIFELDNSYLIIYQTDGYTDILFEMVKNKIESRNPYVNPWSNI